MSASPRTVLFDAWLRENFGAISDQTAINLLHAGWEGSASDCERKLIAAHDDLAAKQHQFMRETLRSSEFAALLRCWLEAAEADNCDNGIEPNPWRELMEQTRALLAKPINLPPWPRAYTEEEGDAYMHGWFDGNDAPKYSAALPAPADQGSSGKPMPGTMGWDWLMWFASEMHAKPTASLAEILDRLGYVRRPDADAAVVSAQHGASDNSEQDQPEPSRAAIAKESAMSEKCWLNGGKCIEPNYCKHPTHCAKNDTRA